MTTSSISKMTASEMVIDQGKSGSVSNRHLGSDVAIYALQRLTPKYESRRWYADA